eukprot:RCo043199
MKRCFEHLENENENHVPLKRKCQHAVVSSSLPLQRVPSGFLKLDPRKLDCIIFCGPWSSPSSLNSAHLPCCKPPLEGRSEGGSSVRLSAPFWGSTCHRCGSEDHRTVECTASYGGLSHTDIL